MNRFIVNTRDYNTPDTPVQETDPVIFSDWDEGPSTFYDFAAPQKVRIVGYDPDLQGPQDLLDEMRRACQDL